MCAYFDGHRDKWRVGTGEQLMVTQPSVLVTAAFLICCHRNGEETFFLLHTTTKMGKMLSAYAKRKGVADGSLLFLLRGRGQQIKPEQTIEDLGLNKGPQNQQINVDVLDCPPE